jgi:hypothetical protein
MAMTTQANGGNRVFTEDQVEMLMAEIEKGQQVAGHFPSEEVLDRARRTLTGEITPQQARAEVLAKYADRL